MINWINTSKSGRHGTEYIAVSIIKSRSLKRVNGKSTTQVILRFSSDAQKDLRLISGDKLLIGFDETTKQICFPEFV